MLRHIVLERVQDVRRVRDATLMGIDAQALETSAQTNGPDLAYRIDHAWIVGGQRINVGQVRRAHDDDHGGLAIRATKSFEERIQLEAAVLTRFVEHAVEVIDDDDRFMCNCFIDRLGAVGIGYGRREGRPAHSVEDSRFSQRTPRSEPWYHPLSDERRLAARWLTAQHHKSRVGSQDEATQSVRLLSTVDERRGRRRRGV